MSVVDLAASDPSFVPLTANSLVREGDLDLDEYDANLLVLHPVVVDAGDETSWDTFVSATEVENTRAAGDISIYDYFPWLSAAATTPMIVVADMNAALFGWQGADELVRTNSFNRYQMMNASLLVAASAVAVRALVMELLGGSLARRRAVGSAIALLYAFGTSAWSTASRAMWQHTLSLLFMSIALWAVARLVSSHGHKRRGPSIAVLAGTMLAASAAARPTNAIVVGAVCLWVLLVRPRVVLWVAAGGIAVALCFVLANVVMLGTVLPEYYAGSRVAFHSQLGEAVAAQWISPNRGLLWASPWIALAVPGSVIAWRSGREHRIRVVCLWGAVAGVTFSASAFAHWWAGHSYGPRFMIEALLPLIVLSLPAWDRLVDLALLPTARRRAAALTATGAAVLWSFAFHGLGANNGTVHCWNGVPVNVDAQPDRIWSITDSFVGLAVKTGAEHPIGFARGRIPCEDL